MSSRIRIISGKGDWTASPPTGADDRDLQSFSVDFVTQAGVRFPEDGELETTERGTPGMAVDVAAGTVYVENDSWALNTFEPRYWIVDQDATEEVSISSNPSGSTRIDLICQQIDTVTTPNDTADNVAPLVVVEGTPGAGAPSTPANHELIAEVEVGDGATSILNANITDRRRKMRTLFPDYSVTTIASSATPTPEMSKKVTHLTITALAAAAELQNPTGYIEDRHSLIIRIKDNGTARALTYDTAYRAIGLDLPDTTVISKTLYLGGFWNAADSTVDIVAVAEEE